MRYHVINESFTAHCCFSHSVIDIKCEHDDARRVVCECFSAKDAVNIAKTLNAQEASDETQ